MEQNYKDFAKVCNDIYKLSGADRIVLATISGLSDSLVDKIFDGLRRPNNTFIVHFIALFKSLELYSILKQEIIKHKIESVNWTEVQEELLKRLPKDSDIYKAIQNDLGV